MKWVTRERPKIDRLACPWLIRRFIDKDAEFRYVPASEVRRQPLPRAPSRTTFPTSSSDTRVSGCSFDAFIRKYQLDDPALARLADIVRAADTDRLDRSPQAPGLLAITLGLGANIKDDLALLEAAMPIYDALLTWCRSLRGERHGWYPEKLREEMSI
jgi:hypothetical protein